MTPRKDLKVGDLVRYAWNGASSEKPEDHGKKVGMVVGDRTMTCTHGGVEPYRMGSMMVMWPEGNIERVTYECLEIAA